MLRISELELVSHVPAVAVPPQVIHAAASTLHTVANDMIRTNTTSPSAFRNHAPPGNPQAQTHANEKQAVSVKHLDRFV